MAVRDRGPLPQAVGAEVDEGDAHAALGPAADEDVLELEVAVDDARLVQRGERLEDAPGASA